MTTATDQTPDVRVDNPDTGEIYPSQVLDHAAALDGIATDTALHAALAHNAALSAELERVKAELVALQAKVGPLDEAWTPPKENPTLWVEETLKAQWAAAHRPSYDTHTLIADSHRREREAVNSLLDYTEQVTTHEPADVWDDDLRALLDEPVRVDYSYRNSEAWTWAAMVSRSSEAQGKIDTPALCTSAEAQEFLDQGPAPDESMGGRPGREGLDRLVKRVPTKISTEQPPRDTRGDVTIADYINSMEALDAHQATERSDAESTHSNEGSSHSNGHNAVTTSQWKRPNWLTRIFDALFPIKPREPRKRSERQLHAKKGVPDGRLPAQRPERCDLQHRQR